MTKYKRLRSDKLPKAALNFIAEANYSGYGGFLDAWYKGEIHETNDWILVMINGDNDDDAINNTLYRNGDGTIKEKRNFSMYQTFLTHKALRNGEVAPPDPKFMS